jgi:DNA-binding MarR family transcriptional regulator
MTTNATDAVGGAAAGASGESHVDVLERAFARLAQIFKTQVRTLASGVHPDLRPAGWHVLRMVLKGTPAGGHVTVGDIIVETAMDKSVVSRQLRSLKEWGLVTLTRSDTDARVFVAKPTAEALARYDAVRKHQRELYAQALEGWDDDDVAKLEELLGRLVESRAL